MQQLLEICIEARLEELREYIKITDGACSLFSTKHSSGVGGGGEEDASALPNVLICQKSGQNP